MDLVREAEGSPRNRAVAGGICTASASLRGTDTPTGWIAVAAGKTSLADPQPVVPARRGVAAVAGDRTTLSSHTAHRSAVHRALAGQLPLWTTLRAHTVADLRSALCSRQRPPIHLRLTDRCCRLAQDISRRLSAAISLETRLACRFRSRLWNSPVLDYVDRVVRGSCPSRLLARGAHASDGRRNR